MRSATAWWERPPCGLRQTRSRQSEATSASMAICSPCARRGRSRPAPMPRCPRLGSRPTSAPLSCHQTRSRRFERNRSRRCWASPTAPGPLPHRCSLPRSSGRSATSVSSNPGTNPLTRSRSSFTSTLILELNMGLCQNRMGAGKAVALVKMNIQPGRVTPFCLSFAYEMYHYDFLFTSSTLIFAHNIASDDTTKSGPQVASWRWAAHFRASIRRSVHPVLKV